MGLTVFHGLRF